MRLLEKHEFVGHRRGFGGCLPRDEYIQSMFTYLQENYDFKNILEIGFCFGHSATWFLETFPKAKVTSFDIEVKSVDKQDLYKLLKSKYSNFKFHHEPSLFVPKFYSPGTFDFAFIDGDHTCGGVVNDIETCLVQNIPLLLIDNMELPQQQRAVNFYKDNLKLIKQFPYYTTNRDLLVHKRYVNLYDVLSYDL